MVLLRLRRDGAEEGDVIVGVEAAEIALPGRIRLVDLHVLQQPVVREQGVGHANSMRLHRVALAVVVVSDIGVIEVAHLALRPIRTRSQRVPADIHGGASAAAAIAAAGGRKEIYCLWRSIATSSSCEAAEFGDFENSNPS